MKKNFNWVALAILLASSMTFAATAKNLQFVPISWHFNAQDAPITITPPADKSYTPYVFIAVSTSVSTPDYQVSGINLKNCGDVTHVAPGSAVVCAFTNQPITLSIDNCEPNHVANGTYQVEIK